MLDWIILRLHNQLIVSWFCQTDDLNGKMLTPGQRAVLHPNHYAHLQWYIYSNRQCAAARHPPVGVCFRQLFGSMCWLKSPQPANALPWISTLLTNVSQSHLWAYWFMVRPHQDRECVWECVCDIARTDYRHCSNNTISDYFLMLQTWLLDFYTLTPKTFFQVFQKTQKRGVHHHEEMI